MARSARQARQAKEPVRRPSPLQEGAAAVGSMISRNPVLVGGSTAFMVSLFYVSANALWYQPHAHTSAFFATREFSWPADRDATIRTEPETTIQIERPAEVPPVVRPKSDPVVEQVQGVLKTLNFYDGTVDGLSGPATSRAIEAYQQKMGLNATDQIDDQLLNQLGLKSPAAAIPPVPAPQPRPAPSQARPAAAVQPEPAQQQPSAAAISQRIAKIQEGLRAFGNADIASDGVAGARTKAAIKEFQSLFGLPQTGEPDEAVYVKMKTIGLTH
ncbi:peptidoglycan hydrolase-like protein with peptidoglycan-binding domain [Mesorhizobium soli]|uniref:peptidoglycan-binding domain-containing protein n=1 Tax=Pseudaminobacter soli (ex Li et al. 2025) TaxID=1295366 RepID=UPI002475D79E|nr:peptidoglycan-binding domain-containing protein [Mesorhizobium soli]MDH6230080.1 peptidoglycan hydrolase-like protein with peptidoglycan-binding domain [Mesorhizobium soli]